MLTLEQLNLLDDVQTAAHFRRCCASNTWVDLMVKSKAYISEQDLLSKAKSIWQSLEEEDFYRRLMLILKLVMSVLLKKNMLTPIF